MQSLIKKRKIFFSAVRYLFKFLVIKTLDPDRDPILVSDWYADEMPDLDSVTPDPQHRNLGVWIQV